MQQPRQLRSGLLGVLLLGLATGPAGAAELLDDFEDRVTEFSLDNGLHFIVVERHQAPVVSFHTHVDVGSVNEEIGATGLAHMFEHMAFKGTTSIGTKDIEAELEAMQRVDEIFADLRRERAKLHGKDEQRIEALEQRFRKAIEAAEQHVEEGELEEILEREGVQGLNAYTAADMTGYLYSLPANKLELFFATESDRFLHPVLREFYTERDVVMEERRQRVGSNPIGRMAEEALAAAYIAHPYGQPTIGHMSDLRNLSRPAAREFYDRYYTPANMTIGIAGDVDPATVRDYAERYFARLSGDEPPLPVTTEEPEQRGERRVTLVEQTQPFVAVAYHRPSVLSEDDAVYSVLQDILGRGRTSLLHENLVQNELALQVQVLSSFPGGKYPPLFLIFAATNQDVDPGAVEEAMYEQLKRLKSEPIDQEALERAKIRARANLVGQLDSNMGLARRLSTAHALTGDWREIFRQLERIQAVTAEDVQRVARETFKRSNRTVTTIANQADESDGDEDDAGGNASQKETE